MVREILKQLPDYQITYFGDTARAPYGNKSRDTIIQYAMQDTQFLLNQGAKIIVIGCNTASAIAADALKKKFPTIPFFDVITPAVSASIKVSKNKRLGVIGTRATIDSGIYEKKIKEKHQGFQIFSKACPLFVPLVEENWIKQPFTKVVARKYLYTLRLKQIDSLILGCTHYPLLRDIIQNKIGKKVILIDPAEHVAMDIKRFLSEHSDLEESLSNSQQHQFYFSDITPHLIDLIHKWLGQKINPRLHSF